jgi:GntR family transcriptional regulator
MTLAPNTDTIAATQNSPWLEGDGPVYLRIAGWLRSGINTGRYPSGSSLPTERELSQQLSVSRQTLRKSIDLLSQEGLVKVKQGSGTVVTGRLVEPLTRLMSFSEDMQRRGLQPGSRWLKREKARPSIEESVALSLSLNEWVIRMSRVRTADDMPMALETAIIDAKSVGGDVDFGESLYRAMQQHGAAPIRAIQRIRAGVATEEVARLLDVPPSSAVLDIERRSYSLEGRPLEWTRSIYRGDLYDYVVELGLADES